MKYTELSKEKLSEELEALRKEYTEIKNLGLKLDMSRGKPAFDQIDCSNAVIDSVNASTGYKSADGTDCRNYGGLDGISEVKELFAQLMEVPAKNVIVGGNSSLNLMFDVIAQGVAVGFGNGAWATQNAKFLCPAPGYDRHFAITEYFGIEMINIDMDENGPDMDAIEEHVKDPAVKGIWNVPKYNNPLGITYSDEVVRRMAALKPASPDFLNMWDNAYNVHHLGTEDGLLNIFTECEKIGTTDNLVYFSSFSKITLPGAGISAMASGDGTVAKLKKRLSFQTIGPDKMNQLRHAMVFKSIDDVINHMEIQGNMLLPKFEAVLDALDTELAPRGLGSYTRPNGGYFISFDTIPGCASRVGELCKEAGLVLTPIGATFPYGKDPENKNVRIAPTFPPVDELKTAMKLFCCAVKIASIELLVK